QRWWEQRPAPGAGTPAQGTPAPVSSSRPRPQAAPPPVPPSAPAAPPGAALPAPPPLSAPLGMAGTGPMPQLSQTMMPSDTIWWTRPPAGQAQGQPGPGYRGSGYQGSAPSAPMPRGYAPHAPVPTPPGPLVPGPAAPATRTQTGPVVGAVALALGVLLLVIGAASHIGVVVIGGLVLGAWGMWRLVSATGRGGKPPG
ncbi:MAG TPA: hypothetical protein VK594_18245, partial [Streptosporangiaceae bacterium]|nr:hypothetical protein [Streptosporangiaceae bacterium]